MCSRRLKAGRPHCCKRRKSLLRRGRPGLLPPKAARFRQFGNVIGSRRVKRRQETPLVTRHVKTLFSAFDLRCQRLFQGTHSDGLLWQRRRDALRRRQLFKHPVKQGTVNQFKLADKLNHLSREPPFKAVEPVQGVVFLREIAGNPLKIVHFATGLKCPAHHLPLHQVVWHGIAVNIVGCAVYIAAFIRKIYGNGPANRLSLAGAHIQTGVVSHGREKAGKITFWTHGKPSRAPVTCMMRTNSSRLSKPAALISTPLRMAMRPLRRVLCPSFAKSSSSVSPLIGCGN